MFIGDIILIQKKHNFKKSNSNFYKSDNNFLIIIIPFIKIIIS